MNPEPAGWYQNLLKSSYSRMGWSYYEKGRFEEAIPFLKEAIRIDPTSSWHQGLLGAAYYRMGNLEEAIPFLKEAISLWPDNLQAHVVLAAAYSLAGRMEEAHAQTEDILRIDPEFSLEDIANYEHFYFLKGDKERFSNALRKAGLK